MLPEEKEITEEDRERAKVVADRLMGKKKPSNDCSEVLNNGLDPSIYGNYYRT